MEFLGLPNELLLSVADVLPIEDFPNLLLACHELTFILTPHLYRRLAQNKDGPTPLQWAAEHGQAFHNHPSLIRILFKHGASISATDRSGMTPLQRAASLEAVEATRALLDLGAGIGDGMVSPAREAARKGSLGCMKAIIDAGFDLNITDCGGKTVIHHACFSWETNVEMLKYLLAQEGARTAINAQDDKGLTPLHLAAGTFGAEHTRLLLHHGADMGARNNEWITPAQKAVLSGNIESVSAFIEAGYGFDVKDWRNRTILHEAALSDIEMVEYLIGLEGAQCVINARDSNGLTPLHLALGSHFETDKVRLLLHHGADMEVRDVEGDTPVHKAASLGSAGSMRAFIEAGFDINTRGRLGRTIFHNITTNYPDEMAQYLLRTFYPRDSLSCKPADGQTVREKRATKSVLVPFGPSSQSMQKGHNTETQTTGPGDRWSPYQPRENGPSEQAPAQGEESAINARDDMGSTPLHLTATAFAGENLMRELVRYGADPEMKDLCGNTAERIYSETRVRWSREGRGSGWLHGVLVYDTTLLSSGIGHM